MLLQRYGADRAEEALVVFAHPGEYLASQKVEEPFLDRARAVASPSSLLVIISVFKFSSLAFDSAALQSILLSAKVMFSNLRFNATRSGEKVAAISRT